MLPGTDFRNVYLHRRLREYPRLFGPPHSRRGLSSGERDLRQGDALALEQVHENQRGQSRLKPRLNGVEPPRVCRRSQLLRGWGHGNEEADVEQIFT
jgi:hypothetical protein